MEAIAHERSMVAKEGSAEVRHQREGINRADRQSGATVREIRAADAPSCQTFLVASVGGVDLELDDPDVVAGAVFLTTADQVGISPWTAEPVTVVPVTRQRVRLVGSQAAFVSLLQGSFGADDTMVPCYELAQRALDLEAAHGEFPLSLRRADEQHIFWWRHAGQITLRIVITRPLLVSSRASVGHIERYQQSTTGTGLLPRGDRDCASFASSNSPPTSSTHTGTPSSRSRRSLMR